MTLQKPEETGRDGITRHTPHESWTGAMINSREMINSTHKWVGKGGGVGPSGGVGPALDDDALKKNRCCDSKLQENASRLLFSNGILLSHRLFPVAQHDTRAKETQTCSQAAADASGLFFRFANVPGAAERAQI